MVICTVFQCACVWQGVFCMMGLSMTLHGGEQLTVLSVPSRFCCVSSDNITYKASDSVEF